MLIIGAHCRLLFALLFIGLGGSCHERAPAFWTTSPAVITKVDIYYKDFDSTSPVELDESSLKTASDDSLSITNRQKIEFVVHELDSLQCSVVSDTSRVGDLRLLVELSDSGGRSRTWRGSRFYFQSQYGGSICKMTSLDRRKLEGLLSTLMNTASKSKG